ncbi:KpsF/GutQ family sugar-phosphate isomerase [Pseudobacteriovorax antillogorgiicola]|uniref:Arabinose-5-phosphate isomerase n=1 Tax=Pseudobacteriovorax antillogorgiicola TaxID=1513793 RepID=A0A1Y6C0R3_9BACT|nr:KpsF/GutQ family sugar-phosphate isomerase [Pseudobacteriovorax antillogorgiicola]TCS50630.1 arabinose-5-phosphate isomerase [Pseudobacteriovorax antillogorgiicola]SMF39466.1 arabinose-5-phosphate isomerase [Pseudobacteriovorax antillogorgiicola]
MDVRTSLNSEVVSPIIDSISVAKKCLREEAQELMKLADSVSCEFSEAIDAIYGCQGRLIVLGMGKSGLVGKKIAATLASTGTPSFFIHPGEAFHGDLGMIVPQDMVLLLSYSGETAEICSLLRPLKQFGNKTIAIVGNKDSTLGREVNYCLEAKVEQEICPLNLAPTSSTTAAMALGDAIAVTLMKKRNFAAEQFARFHPGGSLGRRLLTRVEDVMLKDDLPMVTADDGIEKVIFTMTASAIGIAIVANDRKLLGVITDSDIRSAFASIETLKDVQAKDIMTPQPKTILASTQISQAREFIKENPCRALVVLDDNENIVGLYGRDRFN